MQRRNYTDFIKTNTRDTKTLLHTQLNIIIFNYTYNIIIYIIITVTARNRVSDNPSFEKRFARNSLRVFEGGNIEIEYYTARETKEIIRRVRC